ATLPHAQFLHCAARDLPVADLSRVAGSPSGVSWPRPRPRWKDSKRSCSPIRRCNRSCGRHRIARVLSRSRLYTHARITARLRRATSKQQSRPARARGGGSGSSHERNRGGLGAGAHPQHAGRGPRRLAPPRPIDWILRAAMRGVSQDQLVQWLRAMVGASGRRRHPQERDLIIKFDGWHVTALPLLRRAFPQAPWAFIYREPVEVLVRMAQRFPGEVEPALAGLTWPQVAAMPVERYCAVILRAICTAAVEQYAQGGGLLIDHDELPDAACTRLLEHFGLHYDAAELARMRAVARFDAKQPTQPYADDRAAKRSMATPEI